MQNTALKLLVAALVFSMVSACAGRDKKAEAEAAAKRAAEQRAAYVSGLEFEKTEPVKGKLNVYSSMARAVKYNTANQAQNLHKIVFNKNHSEKPQTIVRTLIDGYEGLENELYTASRVLDYAVLYAASYLNENEKTSGENISAKAAQQLALGAIKAHKNALFALKKIKETDRLAAREKRALAAINTRLERNGVLSDEDLANKKELDVFLLKLSELKKALQMDVKDYRDLIRADNNVRLELEGRHFYELEDFDARNVLDTFQTAAVDNRRELDGARLNSSMYRAPQVKQAAMRAYPEIERLNVNGYGPKDKMYADSLYRRAIASAENLIASVQAYVAIDQEKEPVKKKSAKTEAYDNLGIAILAQTEVDFNLVRAVDADAKLTEKDIRDAKKRLADIAKKHHLNAKENKERLDEILKLIELEVRLSQIKAERAVALRGLYFHSGLSPFSKKLLYAEIKEIDAHLKTAFNKDMTEMLAKAKRNTENEPARKAGNAWAQSSNWLEELVDGSSVAIGQPVAETVKKYDNFEPYTDKKFDAMTIMQLGAYRQKENAELDWSMLSELYPELKNYIPQVERSEQGGRVMYRLTVVSPNGGLRELCNRLRRSKTECLLR